MTIDGTRSSGEGLERSCEEQSLGWLRGSAAGDGVERLEAWFRGVPYHTHRHDTYAVCLTESGAQVFDYCGGVRLILPGEVAVLHPDEPHNGRAGSDEGFGYRLLYIDPAKIFTALQARDGGTPELPFVRDPVAVNPVLAEAIRSAFRNDPDPLAHDDLIERIAAGLADADPSYRRTVAVRRIDRGAIERARQLLDEEKDRVIRSEELEAVTGLSRYELARQFRRVMGTSPYRYSVMRRLGFARTLIVEKRPLVDIALETGFADQAHFTRMFTAAFGMSPARYRASQD
jgi:AraC-like DNA-binding protein